jgi:hypothetical protein
MWKLFAVAAMAIITCSSAQASDLPKCSDPAAEALAIKLIAKYESELQPLVAVLMDFDNSKLDLVVTQSETWPLNGKTCSARMTVPAPKMGTPPVESGIYYTMQPLDDDPDQYTMTAYERNPIPR